MANYWFKHDYNARNDDKLLELRAEFGWEGYGLFYAIIETMCEHETGAIDPKKCAGLAVSFGISKTKLLRFLDHCLTLELFFKDSAGLIRNERVIKHLEKRRVLKEAGRRGAKKRWQDNDNTDSDSHADGVAINGANGNPNAEQNRTEQIRTDNTKPTGQKAAQGYSERFEQFWDLYDVKKGKKKAWLEWRRLSETAIAKIFENVPIFLTHFSSKQYTPRPRKYLYNRYWEDEDYQKPNTKNHEQPTRKTKGDQRAKILRESAGQ